MLVLPEMNVQTPLQNTKPATVTASQLKQPSAPQAAIPGGNPFSDISWLAVEEVNQQGSGTEAPQHGPTLTYIPNFQAALNCICTQTINWVTPTRKQGTTLITRVCFHILRRHNSNCHNARLSTSPTCLPPTVGDRGFPRK